MKLVLRRAFDESGGRVSQRNLGAWRKWMRNDVTSECSRCALRAYVDIKVQYIVGGVGYDDV